jgi:hypothetical protein
MFECATANNGCHRTQVLLYAYVAFQTKQAGSRVLPAFIQM